MVKWLLPILVSILIALLTSAERFYVRFYPEVETQKRHLKTIALWILNALALAAQGWVLIEAFREPMPTTMSRLMFLIIRVGFAVSFLVTYSIILILTRLLKYLQKAFMGQTQISRDLLGMLRLHSEVLVLVATAMTPEVRESIEKILTEE